ncbi:MAG: hypothetical protein NDI73_11595, partial [Desulfuromonadales bacterium]|nr:hypothetical protein [Desulfuromonadales bacterium]
SESYLQLLTAKGPAFAGPFAVIDTLENLMPKSMAAFRNLQPLALTLKQQGYKNKTAVNSINGRLANQSKRIWTGMTNKTYGCFSRNGNP